MNGLTIALLIFTILLYIYLVILHRELVYHGIRHIKSYLFIIGFAIATFLVVVFFPASFDDNVRGILAGFLILSFLFDGKGLASDRISVNGMDKRGIPYREVERVVLYETKGQVRMNFFRKGMRGPLLIFNEDLPEIVGFISIRLKEGTPIDILLDQHTNDDEEKGRS